MECTVCMWRICVCGKEGVARGRGMERKRGREGGSGDVHSQKDERAL